MRRGGAQKALIVDKPLVCQRGLPGRLSSHCAAVGGPVFRRCALRVLAPLAASRPSTASDRDGNAFLPQTQAFALQKMPEMTYMPSFLIIASFFRYFVNALFLLGDYTVFAQKRQFDLRYLRAKMRAA